ncbi:hypothetical protein [Actinacidiphila glaucinigra]|uniref:hypothetical protein n=1 Tax=Actinacidiphila glaucinigra TaxID=235986 RepID=UPI0035E03CE5
MAPTSGTALIDDKRPQTGSRALEEIPTASLLPRLGSTALRFIPSLWLFAIVKTIGFTVFMYLLEYSGDYHTKEPRFGGGSHQWDVLGTWDGWWYQEIARNGYDPGTLIPIQPGGLFTAQQNSAAFFPLYPGLIRLISECTGLGTFGAGILVSTASSFIAAAGIYAIADHIGGHRAGIIAAALWGVAPGSGVQWAVYSDSLFVALAAWVCYCVMTRRWLSAGLLAFAAGLNRPTAAALIGALGLSALVTLYRGSRTSWPDGFTRPIAAMAIAPLGLVGYIGWVGYRMGDWGGYFALQREAWAHYFDYGQYTLHAVRDGLIGRHTYVFAFPVPDQIALLLVVALPTLIVLLLRQRVPLMLVAYTLATVVAVLGTQQIFANTSRYLLPAFPLLLPLAMALRRVSWTSLAVMLTSLAAASGWYAGYALFELGIP